MRVMVTGGAGYIGSVLLPHLIKAGYRVRLVDKFFFGQAHLRALLAKVEVVRADICTLKQSAFDNVDAVIHLAALSNDPMANFSPELNYYINTEATARMGRLAKRAGVKRFIFASSCSIYQQKANDHHLYKESDPVGPKEYYSHSKYLAEQLLLPLAEDKFVVTVLRKGTVGGYSPRLRLDLVVNTMVKTALSLGKLVVNDGKQHRPLVDIQDVAKAYLVLLKAPKEKINRQIFNLAYKNYSILPLAREVRRVLQRELKKDFDLEIRNRVKDRTYRVSMRKLTQAVSWKPRGTMKKSVQGLLRQLRGKKIDFAHPFYYNIERMKQLFPKLT